MAGWRAEEAVDCVEDGTNEDDVERREERVAVVVLLRQHVRSDFVESQPAERKMFTWLGLLRLPQPLAYRRNPCFRLDIELL